MKENSDLILYKASAGSGKTYTLAKEYIKILAINPYDYNKILAVTFTKKATAEMKTRIIEYLSLLERKDADVTTLRALIIDEIKQENDIDVSPFFDQHIHIALQLILHNYSHFNISTIDSFFQSIIRSFAKELDLPIGMEVELDTDLVINKAVEAMLKEYKTDKDAFSRWIEAYVIDLIEEDKSWKIENHISKFAQQLLKEEYQLIANATAEDFDIETYKAVLNELKQTVFSYKRFMDEKVQQVEAQIKQENLDISAYFQGNRSVQSFINNTKNYEPEANSYIQGMLNGSEDLFSKQVSKNVVLANQLTTAWNAYIQPFIVEVLSYKEKHELSYNSSEIVLKHIYAFALLEYINTQIKIYKSEKDLILISDTNQIVSLISKHEDVPFIFEKSANFLEYILIDEFQDTSQLQWDGMLPLLLEILQKQNGKVLIVGDPKQSIYRWRGGKMELIIDGIKQGMPNNWQTRKDEPLTKNFRSAHEIVTFNNAFFASVKQQIHLNNSLFEQVYTDAHQFIQKENKKGYVSCKWLEKPNKEEKEDKHLTEILSIIKSLENTHRYSDIAVLTRTNVQGANIANFLQENNIPVVSAESLLLMTQATIKLLIAALQYVLHPTETFYRVKLNYLYAQFMKAENSEQYLSQKTAFIENKIPFFKAENVALLSAVSINELTFLILQAVGLDMCRDSYIVRFQDVVYKFEQQHTGSLRAFLVYWEEQKEKLSILPPEGMDAVKLYTIHKSKGLQFPVVILPYANWSMQPKSDTTKWIKCAQEPFNKLHAFPVPLQKKLEKSYFSEIYQQELDMTYIDNVNMLYVAMTRPEEQLYILSTIEKTDKEVLPNTMSKFLKRILTQVALPNASHDEHVFIFGTPAVNNTTTSETLSTFVLQATSFQAYQSTLSLKQSAYFNEAQEKGAILHEILSNITEPSQLDKAVVQTAPHDTAYFQQEATKVLQFFEQQNWIGSQWQALNERDVWYNNEILRPDKVLLNDTVCIIIDFKTGAKEKAHIQQVQKYKTAYTALLAQQVQTYLLYTDTLELQEV